MGQPILSVLSHFYVEIYYIVVAQVELSITQLSTTPFRWAWDFNHWVPLMLHFPLQLHRKKLYMFNLNLKKLPSLMNEFNISMRRSMIYYKKLILSANDAMINTQCHTNFKWEIRFGCIYRRNTLQMPIISFTNLLWNLQHHQGCGWQCVWAKYIEYMKGMKWYTHL